MIRCAIQTQLDNRQFVPGEILQGRVGWQSDAAIKKAELRLFYFTSGRGTRDVEVVNTQVWKNPSSAEKQEFSFNLPAGPYSFSGQLISLEWALELVISPGNHTERLEFTLSPDGNEVDLQRHPVDEALNKRSAGKNLLRKMGIKFDDREE